MGCGARKLSALVTVLILAAAQQWLSRRAWVNGLLGVGAPALAFWLSFDSALRAREPWLLTAAVMGAFVLYRLSAALLRRESGGKEKS
jgi:hypothetical protein